MDTPQGILVLLILVFGVPGLALFLYGRLREAQKELEASKTRVDNLESNLLIAQKSLQDLKEETDPLRQYKGILDLDKAIANKRREAEDLIRSKLDEAKVKCNELVEQGNQSLTEAKTESQKIRQQARQFKENSETKASEIMDLAKSQSAELMTDARKKAEEIAGEALFAKENADRFEDKAKAMKNTINGYGDEYLIPNHSTIDELAEDFDHKQAGQELKAARNKTKDMIKHNTAADCDYSEKVRRRTAIKFVLDAFNGKVDSILSKVKHDNYGKLEQEIKDSYTVVNMHGEAFRNARITELYLTARIRELKWSVAVNELKIQEREEQKAIREQMREEERARKEIEKAIREAEKEEKMLQKAMEKARKELAAAGDAEREKFERQLEELTSKLSEAEAKNQRALSMAQQTRRGHVYVISNEGSFGENVYKIGMTRRLEPMDRVKELGDASVPFPFDVHAIINSEDAPTLENELHNFFSHARLNKVNLRKEFFSTTIAEIRQAVEDYDLEVHWTMSAEAAEYRESRAISKQNESSANPVLELA
ncbi:DUF4041 domain-containing protein [uncultured Pseudoteredinibacter sp.]|uniref:GIY-YIG nuclease family protein n=1 Tax=uncultured Pseudoteredinibacter sp. TaxID=1641701 RepID=UPI002618F841|nr:DUF4041 domain-containing protein [uncultured Pseudoteredinibacter sp.]